MVADSHVLSLLAHAVDTLLYVCELSTFPVLAFLPLKWLRFGNYLQEKKKVLPNMLIFKLSGKLQGLFSSIKVRA